MTQEIWFNGAKTEEERDKVKQDLALAHNAFKRMEEILSAKLKLVAHVSDYDKASWPFYQADNNGYNRALTEVLKIINRKGH